MDKSIIRLTESDIVKMVKEAINETSRRQKAVSNFLGKNNNVKTFGIITAENPMGKKFPPQENLSRNAMLKSYLQQRQYIWFPVKGKYGNKENPFLIYNVSLDDMKTIGRTFDQESFIYSEIIHRDDNPVVVFSYYQKDYPEDMRFDTDGRKIKPKDREYHFVESKEEFIRFDDTVDDYFTSIGRHFKFSIPFDIFNEQIHKINNMIDDRCANFDSYRRCCQRLINESVSDDITPHGRHVRRAQLYGKHYENFWKNR